MTTDRFSPALKQLINENMASGHYASEEALLLEALRCLQSDEEELQAVQEGIESVDRGDPGVPLDEAFDRLRKKYDIHAS